MTSWSQADILERRLRLSRGSTDWGDASNVGPAISSGTVPLHLPQRPHTRGRCDGNRAPAAAGQHVLLVSLIPLSLIPLSLIPSGELSMKCHTTVMALFAALSIGFVGCDTTEPAVEREADVGVMPGGEVDGDMLPEVAE